MAPWPKSSLTCNLRIWAVYFGGGAEKVVFGTDYPVETLDNGLSLVSMLKVTQADKERILWRNASRLYSI